MQLGHMASSSKPMSTRVRGWVHMGATAARPPDTLLTPPLLTTLRPSVADERPGQFVHNMGPDELEMALMGVKDANLRHTLQVKRRGLMHYMPA